MPYRNGETDVAIVGAGAAGIAASRRLGELSHNRLLLEARNRPGGRAHTIEVTPGVYQDLGAHFMHSGSINPLVSLARQHGFEVPEVAPAWSRRRAAKPLDEDGLVRRRAAINAAFDAAEAAGKAGRDEPISRYAAEAGAWETMFRAVITWYSSHEAEQVSTLDYSRYEDTYEDWPLPIGYGTLLTYFANKEPLISGCTIRRISRLPDRFLLEGDQGRIEAKRVILALPVNVLRAGCPVIEPDLPSEIRDALEAVPMGGGMKIVFSLKENRGPFGEESVGIGSDATSATGAYHALPSGAPLLDGFYGGDLARELEDVGPKATEDFARQEIRNVYGSAADRSLRFHCVTDWNRNPFSRGAYSAAKPGKADLRRRLAESFDDRLFLAGEHCSLAAFSTVHGAWESGLLAAERAAASLG